MSADLILFRQEGFLLQKSFPELKYEEPPGQLPYIHGTLYLKDESGSIIDQFSIRIEPGPDYPKRFPWVFETGGRIPRNINWHVFEDNGNCCIKSLPEELIICYRGITLTSFVQIEIIPYFFNQKYRELMGYFLHERSHGYLGHLEYFMDIFKTRDLEIVEKLLRRVLARNEAKCNSRCACGSRRKYRKCHRRALRKIAILPSEYINHFLRMAID